MVAAEIMINTAAIRDLIAEGRVGEIRDLMTEGRMQYGMQTFDQHLTDLVRAGEVTYEVALGAATRPADFALQFKMLGASIPAPTPAPAPTSAHGAGVAAEEPAGAGVGMDGLQGAGEFDFLNG